MVYRFENFTFDKEKNVISKGNKEFKLTKTQNKLLAYFITNPHKITSKQVLMEQVWGRIVTENSVDQMVSILRNFIECDVSKPKLIVTHYGQGLSFEGKRVDDALTNQEAATKKSNNKYFSKWLLLILPIILLLWLLLNDKVSVTKPQSEVETRDKKLLILPMTFSDESIDSIEQKGMKSLLKTTYNNLESEGDLIFDETLMTTQQAVEKHWKIEDELIVLRSNVVKNGNIYEATIELSNGINYQEKKTLKANNLDELLSKQARLISTFQHDDSLVSKPIDTSYVRALGLQKAGKFQQAHELLIQLLSNQEGNAQARLLLADVLISLKKYDEALSQLTTLKSTQAYKSISTEVELKFAELKLIKNQYQDLINDLLNYQVSNLNINDIKKAKIKILLGKAYYALGNQQEALESFKQAISNVDELINPSLYAQSYYGQAQIHSSNKNDNKVYALFSQSYEYAKSAGELKLQVLALNSMAQNKLYRNLWEEAVELTKKSIDVMELTEDKEEIAKGLTTLVTILNLRGQISEARVVNNRLGTIAEGLNSDNLRLYFLHFDAILDMNQYKYQRAQEQIDKQFDIAKRVKNYSMLLNNGFIQMELLLLKKDTQNFKAAWDERSALIKENGFERFQVYMDLFLGRYYKQLHEDKKAIEILTKVSEQVKSQNDMKVFTDAQNQLAEVYLRSNPKRSLDILNSLEQYNPHPNPYLDLKAAALHKLGKNIEALSVLNKAKLIYHEGWTAQNQALLEKIKVSLK
jgi:DNA-binding winged helix-turn-helix (wHTH) protein/tetratricopeptide (TPR) repeat protein